MFQILRGLVIRSVDYKEADKILTVLTAEYGKLTVSARGARRKGSRISAASQLFAYSEMTLFVYNGRFQLNEATMLEQFSGIDREIETLALASYLAEVLGCEEEQGQGNPPVLRLALNSLYALAKGLYPRRRVKAAFELRYCALAGYAPDLSGGCAACGAETTEVLLAPQEGLLYCRECATHQSGRGFILDQGALEAARYVLNCDLKKLFSFELNGRSEALMEEACEAYLLARLERGFRTLDFYRTLDDSQ
jgi:DNA repair protein RecO (recombination protein O)